jgi:phenylalanyl-tRNA synthetase alpha chain
MAKTLDELKALRDKALADLKQATSPEAVDSFTKQWLGKTGVIPGLKSAIKDVQQDIRGQFGKTRGEIEAELAAAVDSAKQALGLGASASTAQAKTTGPAVDVTEPGLPTGMGRAHVISQTIGDLVEVFGRMGFDVATGPEVEDEFHNFIALNIPESHPARDPLDNFYIDVPKPGAASSATGGALRMLRSQTSTIQIRVMENTQPPIRVVATGRVYRPDEHDATHYSMFHQVEGLYVDKDVSMSDLKTTLIQFVHAYFGADAEIRLRPSFFPFTECSAEIDVKMTIRGQTRWVEVGGCGMVDPSVFQAVGYDPEVWTGFAFGLGIERLAMRKYGIQDIRLLFENDIRFLKQF